MSRIKHGTVSERDERDWRGKEGRKGRERRAGGFFQPAASAVRAARERAARDPSERRWKQPQQLPSLSLSLSHPLSPIQGVSALPPSLSRSLVLTGISLAAALSSAQLSSVTLVRSLARTSVLFPPKTRLQLCCMRQFSAPLPPSFLLTQLLSAVTEKGKVSCDM